MKRTGIWFPAPRCARQLLAALLGALLAAPVAGQRPRIEVFTVSDGLPSSAIQDLEQGPDGRLWIATRGGLRVFDGRTFADAAVEGLPDRRIGRLITERGGRMWAAALREVIPQLYRRDAEAWQALPVPSTSVRSELGALAAVSGAGSPMVAVGALPGGVWRWNGEWKHWGKAEGLPDEHVGALAAVGRRLAVGTRGGLCLLDSEKLDCRLAAQDPRLGMPIRALASARGSGAVRLWILTESWLGYLDSLAEAGEGLGGAGLTVAIDDLSPELMIDSRAALVVDTTDGVYVGGASGVAYLEPNRSGLELLTVRDGLASDGGLALLVDREANVWIGGNEGLSKIESRRFVSWDQSQGLLEDEVTAVVEAAPGLFVLGHDSGLTVLRDGNPTPLPFETFFPAEQLADLTARVFDLANDGRGGVWMAATELGLLRLALANVAGGSGQRRFGLERAPVPAPVKSVETDADGRLWVLAGDELWGRATADAPFARVAGSPKFPGSRWLLTGRDGRLWVSTQVGLRWRELDGSWHEAHAADMVQNSLYAIAETADGKIWAGSGAGVVRLVEETLVPAQRIGGPELDRPIYFLLPDGESRLWIGSDDGVLVWDGQVLLKRSVRHGLAGRETNRGAGYRDHLGRIWVGTDRGLSLYQPRYDRPPLAAPMVELTGIEVNGEVRDLDTTLALDSREGNLTFQIGAVSLSSEEDLLLRYRLDGFDEAWQGPVPYSSETVRYTNVPPGGTYRFRIAARWRGGPWSIEQVSPPISIARPLWRKPWFLALVVGAFGLLLVGAHDLRTRTIRSRNRRLAAVNAELERSISERDKAEMARRESEERYRSVIAAMSEGIILYDTELRPLAFNDSAQQILGLSAEQLGGEGVDRRWRTLREDGTLCLPDEYPAVVTLRDGKPLDGVVYGVVQPDGREIWISLNTHPIVRDGESQPHAVAMSFTDITERRKAEAERERLIEDLEAKNLELERFTYTVSHDLKAPLVTIKGFVGFLRRDVGAGRLERVNHDLARIEDATSKMAQLLEQLLQLSRIGRVVQASEDVALSEVAREALDLVAGRIEARGVEATLARDLPTVQGDRVRLRQVFQNLIENAVKFMGANEEPRLEIGRREEPEHGTVCFVRDNGIGIAPEHQTQVFGLFARLDARKEGSGVGLALVKRVIEVHGGRIWVESDGVDRGACFCFTL